MVVHAASFVTFLGFIDVVDTLNARLKVKSDAKKDGQALIVMKVGYDDLFYLYLQKYRCSKVAEENSKTTENFFSVLYF